MLAITFATCHNKRKSIHRKAHTTTKRICKMHSLDDEKISQAGQCIIFNSNGKCKLENLNRATFKMTYVCMSLVKKRTKISWEEPKQALMSLIIYTKPWFLCWMPWLFSSAGVWKRCVAALAKEWGKHFCFQQCSLPHHPSNTWWITHEN